MNDNDLVIHLSACVREISACRTCMDHFGLLTVDDRIRGGLTISFDQGSGAVLIDHDGGTAVIEVQEED